MADYAISYANLNAIEQSLNNISNGLNSVGSGIDVISHDVGTVNDNVKVVYDSVGQLANEFHDFVMIQVKANNLSNSNGKLIQIRQQLDKQFGQWLRWSEPAPSGVHIQPQTLQVNVSVQGLFLKSIAFLLLCFI